MSWSYSKLSLYEKCPYALTLKKQFKIEPNEHMARGTAIHKECENFLLSGEPTQNINFFLDELSNLRTLNAQAEVPWGLNADWSPADTFNTAWGKCIIDALCIQPNYLLIVDFKTGKPSPISHQDQAQIYAIASQTFYPQYDTIQTEFWYLDSGKKTQTTFTKTQIEFYKIVLNARIARMLSDTKYLPRPGKYNCRYCNYKEHCEYAQK